ncbi:phage DNA packaging protein GP2 [Desulfovibrio sp. X2]|uniref:phage terminase large subunit family protein n=1 Tax=Desulfovibrio sp. X2 TaxID=941449 RepID=UPI000358D211|nr:phage DNA packaging protein GP2 [Desulfovibrio sp. X2]EPR42716.1 phage DNA packaging protein GP2 [Desulfovibrio sp. X2]
MPLVAPGKYLVTATWDDVPHLSAAQKRELWEQTPPHLREARARGVPQLGAGAIYPVPETEITVAPFEIPNYWPRAYGLDVGWNRTAAVWGAWDRDTGVIYLYAEHYRGQAEPELQAHGLRAPGDWIPGVIDPASRGRSQADGRRLMDIYLGLGLDLAPADNAVEAGIYRVWSLLSTGRLKVFASLASWLAEYRLYRRDENGRVVKERDHLMDATRYLVMSGEDVSRVRPVGAEEMPQRARGDYDMFGEDDAHAWV